MAPKASTPKASRTSKPKASGKTKSGATSAKGPSVASTSAPAAAVTANHGLYTKLSKLGEGSFGQIWLMKHNYSGECHVLKEIALAGLSPKEVAACRLERDVMERIKHVNVVAFVNSFEDAGVIGLVMEHAAGGDLQRLIDRCVANGNEHVAEWHIRNWALQLGQAVAYLHSYMLLLHRDIKPANVFLSARGDVRLGDFGMCRLVPCSRINMIPRKDSTNTQVQMRKMAKGPRATAEEADEEAAASGKLTFNKNAVGTPLYMSPEHISGKPFDKHADIWAFGCTVFETMGLESPWSELLDPYGGLLGGHEALLHEVTSSSLDVGRLRAHYSDLLCGYLAGLLARNLADRVPLDEFLDQLQRIHSPFPPAGLKPLPLGLEQADDGDAVVEVAPVVTEAEQANGGDEAAAASKDAAVEEVPAAAPAPSSEAIAIEESMAGPAMDNTRLIQESMKAVRAARMAQMIAIEESMARTAMDNTRLIQEKMKAVRAARMAQM